jgi:hypothetical protein
MKMRKQICFTDYMEISIKQIQLVVSAVDSLCGLVVRVPGYRSRGLGSIPGATRFSEK